MIKDGPVPFEIIIGGDGKDRARLEKLAQEKAAAEAQAKATELAAEAKKKAEEEADALKKKQEAEQEEDCL